MDSEEGQKYMTFYKIKQWPYVAVLDPRTGELLVEWNHADSSTYESLITEFLATTSWGEGLDEEPVEAKPPDAKKMRLVLYCSFHLSRQIEKMYSNGSLFI